MRSPYERTQFSVIPVTQEKEEEVHSDLAWILLNHGLVSTSYSLEEGYVSFTGC